MDEVKRAYIYNTILKKSVVNIQLIPNNCISCFLSYMQQNNWILLIVRGEWGWIKIVCFSDLGLREEKQCTPNNSSLIDLIYFHLE